MNRTRPVLLMLEQQIERTARHMRPEFTTHDYIEKLRDVYPADYAHDLAVCTLERGFPQSLAIVHKAITDKLRWSDRVEAIGTKESRDIRGNSHRTLLWRRLDARRAPPTRRRQEFRSRRKASDGPAPPAMTGAELQEARESAGLTKSELARQAGVSLSAVTRWEANERHMGPVAAEALHNALGSGHTGR